MLISTVQNWQWRVPIAIQIVFVVILMLLATLIPETPRWLASHGRDEQALSVIAQLADRPVDDIKVQAEWTEIIENVRLERDSSGGSSWSQVWRSDANMSRRRFLIACGIQAAQQLGGINVSSALNLVVHLLGIASDCHRRLFTSRGLYSSNQLGFPMIQQT